MGQVDHSKTGQVDHRVNNVAIALLNYMQYKLTFTY